MKPRSSSQRPASSTKSSVTRRAQLAPVVRGPWGQAAETGAREFVTETNLTSSGGDFGFRATSSDQREVR